MADAVKISDLPEVSAVASQDLIVIVDESQTQTSQATLAQVQALGPGPETVTTPTIAPGAVTAPKTGFTASDRISVASTTQTGDGVYTGEETELTPYARTILSSPDAATAFQRIGVSPNFAGPIRVPLGTPTEPSYTFTADDNTGMFGGSQGYINFASNGEVVLSISVDREVYKRQSDGLGANNTVIEGLTTPFIGFNAYAVFTPGQTGTAIDIQGSDAVGRFVGLSNYLASWPGYPTVWHGPTMRYDATTRAGLTYLMDQLGYDPTTVAFYTTRPGDGRTNYTSTGDNYHLILDSNGINIYPTGYPAGAASPSGESAQWIARMTANMTSVGTTLVRRQNVSSIVKDYTTGTDQYGNSVPANTSVGRYRVNFSVSFPDDNYAVVGGYQHTHTTTAALVTVLSKSTDHCIVQVTQHNGNLITTGSEVFVGVFR